MDPLPATILQPSVTAIPATDPTAHLEMIGDEKQSGGNVLLLLAALGGRVEVEGLETCMAGNMGGGFVGEVFIIKVMSQRLTKSSSCCPDKGMYEVLVAAGGHDDNAVVHYDV